MKKLVIIDYFFKDNKWDDGKHDIAIAEEAIKQGIETVVLCPKLNAELVPSFVEKSLRFPSKGRHGLLWYFIEIVSRSFELRRLWKKHKNEKETSFFISTIDDHFFVSLYFSLFCFHLQPKIFVMMRRGLNEYAIRSQNVLTRFKIRVLAPIMLFLHSRKNIVFCSDSELIVANLIRQGLHNSVTLPVLLRITAGNIRRSGNETVITYVGGARFDKGFDLLPFVIEKLIHKEIKFVIQTYLQGDEKKEIIISARKSLLAFSKAYPDKISLIDTPLTELEYSALLKQSDIVLMPYRKMFYGEGISGIFAETVAVGAWAIVPSKSWMSVQRKKYDKIVEVDELTSDEIVLAIERCLKNEGKVNNAAIHKQILSWRTFHSAKTFIELLNKLGDAA